jgi:conserved oligomeric Golgi complex subunit 6
MTSSSSIIVGTNPNEGGSHSILAEKVHRALQVRTDTVAMRAALDALAALDSIDSRNVRTAIEHDALHQALQLQDALTVIQRSAIALRANCATMTATAAQLRAAVHMSVVTPIGSSGAESTPETASMLVPSLSGRKDDLTSDDTGSTEAEREQKLAALLAEAFQHRQQAQERVEAVQSFLEKFNLSSEDSELLSRYNFDDVNNASTTDMDQLSAYQTGFAFLQALQRVHDIRRALHQSDLGTASNAMHLLESLSQTQELAYERLYHWISSFLQLTLAQQDLSSENADALQNPFVIAAVHTMQHVPAFYTHTVELIAASRRSEVTRQFLVALTVGTDTSTPLEMKAHDSVACE